MVERVSGYDGVELVVGEHEDATGPALVTLEAHGRAAPRRRAAAVRARAAGSSSGSSCSSTGGCWCRGPRPRWSRCARVDEAVRLGLRRGAADPWAADGDERGRRRPRHRVGGAGARARERAARRRGVGGRRERRRARGRARERRRGRAARSRPGCASPPARGSTRSRPSCAARCACSSPTRRTSPSTRSRRCRRRCIDWEPYGALVSGPSGLEAIEEIVADAPEWLADDAVLVCELAPHQADTAVELARAAGFAEVEVHPDLTGRDRVLVARTRPTTPWPTGVGSRRGRRARRRRDAGPLPRARRRGEGPSAPAGRRPRAPALRRAGPARLPGLRHRRRRDLGVRRRRAHPARRPRRRPDGGRASRGASQSSFASSSRPRATSAVLLDLGERAPRRRRRARAPRRPSRRPAAPRTGTTIADERGPVRQVTSVGRGRRSSASRFRRTRSRSKSRGGSDTMFSDTGTAASTCAYDMPPSIAANSSPQRKSHDAAPASRAKASGSAIAPRLNVMSDGETKSATSAP